MREEQRKIFCQNLWKVFGPHAERVVDSIRDGITKDEVFNQTGHVIAVRDVSFEVQEGEFFVVMGLSGCGKSVLVRCLNRLLRPTKGRAFIEGEDVGSLDEASLRKIRRKKVSMVFQQYGLFPHWTILDNVAYGLEVQGVDKTKRRELALEALEKVGLTEWKDMYPEQMSGGMQQRAGLARALLVDTEILLMDEPFSGLDPLIRREMQDELINLLSEVNKTVVFITHDLNEAVKLGDRIAVMRDGEIVQIGTPQEIALTPADEYVADFVRDVPKVQVLQAGNIMEKPSELANIDQEPGAVLSTMKAKNLENMFVVGSDQKLRGLVVMGDVTTAVHQGETNLENITKADLAITESDKPMEELISMVAASNIPIAVVDKQQRLLGAVTRVSVLSNIGGA